MSLQHEYEFDTWFEREYPDRDDRQQKFRMSSVRDLMLAAYGEGRRSTSGAASGEVVIGQARIKAEGNAWFEIPTGVIDTYGGMGYEVRALGVIDPVQAEQSAPPVPRMDGLSDAKLLEAFNSADSVIDGLHEVQRALLAEPSASTLDHDSQIDKFEALLTEAGNASFDCGAHDSDDDGNPDAPSYEELVRIAREKRKAVVGMHRTVLVRSASTAPGQAETGRDAARYRYIEDNASTHGGGKGFTITCRVPVDHEDMGCSIDFAIAALSKENGK